MDFEGGFSPRPDGYDPGYPDLMWKPFEPLETYMHKTLRSLVVFNNPSVKGCHSWKLAEYLSWGKAIVSTPLIRMLPAPLEDGIHLLYTDGTVQDMTEKIQLLREDVELRKTIERNARAYFDEHFAADRVMAEVLRCAGVVLPGRY
jgi:glycosyltransferase involved in cell wall biosynthesis